MLVDKHSFRLEIAKEFGIDTAIFLESIAYWVNLNWKNKNHFYNGFYWTRNTLEALTEIFPYWSRRQLERVINNCIDKGLLLKNNHNKLGYDRTLWYTLSEIGLNLFHMSISPNGEIESTKRCNRIHQTVTPIPVTNTITNTVTKYSSSSDDERERNEPPSITIKTMVEETLPTNEFFDLFWEAYPKKVGKKSALKSWNKNKLDEKANIVIADINQRTENNWLGKDKQYIPDPSTYLNGEKWKDEIYKNKEFNNDQPKTKSEVSFAILKDIHHRELEKERLARSESGTKELDYDSLCPFAINLA